MEIFNVTTIKNIDSVVLSAESHIKFHAYEKYTVICPEKDVQNFVLKLSKLDNIKIIDENSILSFSKFSAICSVEAQANNRKNFNQKRLNWYYQQALKIAYAIECDSEFLVMWDADSIPLSKIAFFNGNRSLSYGSLIEYNNKYFNTISEIFSFSPPDMAFTIQFFTLTKIERRNLINILLKYRGKNEGETVAEWVASIIMASVAAKNENIDMFDQSYFSEQELVGLINAELNKSSQKGIMHFRPGRFWKQTRLRLFILEALGYRYITLERNIFPSSKCAELFYFWTFLVFDIYRNLIKRCQKNNRSIN